MRLFAIEFKFNVHVLDLLICYLHVVFDENVLDIDSNLVFCLSFKQIR